MKKILTLLFTLLLAAVMLTACSGADTTEQTETAATTATAQAEEAADTITTAAVSLPDTGEVITTAAVTSSGMIDATDLFTDRDLTQSVDTSDAKSYTLSDGDTITISTAGVYILSGSAENAQIIVEAGDDDKVQLVLNGVTITNTSTPCIYVKNADKVFVTTVSGTTSRLSVTGTFASDGTTNTDAVIFSRDDLVLNGLGTLVITSTDNGISCKDDLKVTGGTIDITCTSDALEANESIAVADGDITISSGKDGLHAENDEDTTVGYIYICGGSFSIEAASDGIQATTVAQIDGGTFNISASEGIEGTYVQINGGDITISASDDGINASAKSSAYSVTAEFNGGTITITMGQGDTDAVDANGNIYVNGGTLDITANSPFDYDGVGQYNGGTLIVNGTQTTELTNQMMGGGGMGGMQGGMGGMQGGMGGMQGGMGGMQGGYGDYGGFMR